MDASDAYSTRVCDPSSPCLFGQGKTRAVVLVSVRAVQAGRRTAVFDREPAPYAEHLSFSLIYLER